MSKKDKQDETPIEFYVPGPGGRGPKIPVPINQPNWKYLGTPKGKPSLLELAAIGLVIIAITASILALSTKIASSPLIWIIIIPLGGFLIYVVYSTIKRILVYSGSENEEDNKPAKKHEKKRPKHRKDYK